MRPTDFADVKSQGVLPPVVAGSAIRLLPLGRAAARKARGCPAQRLRGRTERAVAQGAGAPGVPTHRLLGKVLKLF